MRIAYPMRVDAFDKPGGDLLQILKYVEAGQALATDGGPQFEGEIIDDLHADLSSFDLIHLTNIDRPIDTYCSFQAAKKAKKPIFISPIHHSYREIELYERKGRGGMVGHVSGFLGFRSLEYLRSTIRAKHYPQLTSATLSVALYGMKEAQQAILRGVDRVLVLTQKEKADLTQDFGDLPNEKFSYLRNGFEAEGDDGKKSSFRDIDVCMVGRIESRKNQVVVLKVLKRRGISGVFVGAENQNHKSYCRTFREMIADSDCIHVGSISHEETLQTLRRSQVHVSASWFEVLSLVDLEAYCAGCGVVASNAGGTREILGDRAVYVFPDSEKSIEKGIMTLLERASGDGGLSNHPTDNEPVAENWSQIGRKLADLYRRYIPTKHRH